MLSDERQFLKLQCSENDAHLVEKAEAVELHNTLLANRPEGARHDSDICPFCTDKALDDSTASRNPPGPAGPDVSGHDSQHATTKGGTSETMSDISQETHDALMQKGVADATEKLQTELAQATKVADEQTGKAATLEAELASLKTDNARLNTELDAAQVSLKTAQDEVTALKADIAAKDEAATKAEIASKRAEQVKNLGLFGEDYVSEKASAWADMSDEQWIERLDEWQKLKPAEKSGSTTDSASALSGTSGTLTVVDNTSDKADETKKPSARRAALGLPA